MSKSRVSVVWFRNDLRLQDNYALKAALDWCSLHSGVLLPIYCFDPRWFGKSLIGGFPKTGVFRSKFLIESVFDLRENLKSSEGNLCVRVGKPEEVIPKLIAQLQKTYHVENVYAHKEVTQEELDEETTLKRHLDKIGVELLFSWGHTLVHIEDLPFTPKSMPDVFTTFRKKVENNLMVRKPVEAPKKVSVLHNDAEFWGNIPTLSELYSREVSEPVLDPRGVMAFKGGETAALQRVKEYFWEKDCLRNYKETRNGLVGADYSSKFSAWFWNGCLSPRFVFYQIKKYEQDRVMNESTYWLLFELLWRDFFRFFGIKHGSKIFFLHGIYSKDSNFVSQKWSSDVKLFDKWANGETGHPFVDANMKELNATGWMSNRGRQNVASFLARDLHLDWRLGAEYFESLLIDYDVTSNWCNWQYATGVGNDPRGDQRYFNVIKQGIDYDPKGEFVKLWLPQLQKIPPQFIHFPYKLPMGDQLQIGIQIGVQYPKPIVNVRMPSNSQESGRSGRGTYEVRDGKTVGKINGKTWK